MFTSQRRRLFVPLFAGMMGFGAFFNAVNSPSFAAIRAIDVVRLIAAGACWGVAFAGLVVAFRGGLGPRD
jgi:hypothetical protein